LETQQVGEASKENSYLWLYVQLVGLDTLHIHNTYTSLAIVKPDTISLEESDLMERLCCRQQ